MGKRLSLALKAVLREVSMCHQKGKMEEPCNHLDLNKGHCVYREEPVTIASIYISDKPISQKSDCSLWRTARDRLFSQLGNMRKGKSMEKVPLSDKLTNSSVNTTHIHMWTKIAINAAPRSQSHKLRTFLIWGCKDGLRGKVLAAQAIGPEFGSLATM